MITPSEGHEILNFSLHTREVLATFFLTSFPGCHFVNGGKPESSVRPIPESDVPVPVQVPNFSHLLNNKSFLVTPP